jgi:curved DNA-binding protein
MNEKDYYAILGIGRDCSQEQISQAYRKLARKYHPDVSKEPNAEQRFKDIGEAYEVLKDPDKRVLYDQYGPMWRAVAEGRVAPQPENIPGVDFGDIGFSADHLGDVDSVLQELFGGGGFGFSSSNGGRRVPRGRAVSLRGGDIETVLNLPVREAFEGGERELTLTLPEHGKVRKLKVRIPPRVRTGQKIRLAGQGSQGLGSGGSGDLYLEVRVCSDRAFRLEGDDLYISLPLTPWEAALGTTLTVPTLEGQARVRVPPGSSTGQLIRLKDRGYPTAHGSRGDLFAEVRIEIPKSLSAEERALMVKLSQISSFSPRAVH